MQLPIHNPLRVVTRPLPRVLILHTGGTLGMDPVVRGGPACRANTGMHHAAVDR